MSIIAKFFTRLGPIWACLKRVCSDILELFNFNKRRTMLERLFGQRLKQLREERGWTQDYLADLMGLESGRQIRKWEEHERFPKPHNIEKLAQVFNVKIRDLFYFPEHPHL